MPNPICPTGTTYVPPWGERAYVKGMCIDTKPVSNKSYNAFLERKNKTLSSYRRAKKPLAPVADVSYNDARKYCQSRGMRLLTHLEWIRAFVKSGHSLFGMKGEGGRTRCEYVKDGARGNWIIGHSSGQSGGFQYGSGPPLVGRRPTVFRCAVEPKTYWKNLIIGLAVGLLVDPLLRGARFLGWENPR
ncbi:SUMF1/EgtB/PvdO family nonheme iron enzyme [Candidatus Pacearchaeota archaeon]|nr:SUMF1/EgtB/PvdO family nonheme iron enzyme [Candidatus Pacearchaeota archaeon]